MQKHSPPFDRGVADAHANLECPFYKEAADMYQKQPSSFDLKREIPFLVGFLSIK